MAPTKTDPSSSAISQAKTAASLSVWEKLDILPATGLTLSNLLYALLTYPLRSSASTAPSLYKHVLFSASRTRTRRLSPRQLHYTEPNDDRAYESACKTLGVTPNSIVLEDGTRAHWIGDPKAEKVLVNFHGGGYVLPAWPSHFLFMHRVLTSSTSPSSGPGSLSTLTLSYDLSPRATYPRQLSQAITLLSHLIHNLHISPANILLTGDSAGANLACAVLSHLAHPHPDPQVPRLQLAEGEKLRGAVLVAPWVEFDTSGSSFEGNKYKDVLNRETLEPWSQSFLGSSPKDFYNQAVLAPPSWWTDVPVSEILFVAGKDEVLLSGIQTFANNLVAGLGSDRVKVALIEGEYHDQAVIDINLGFKESEEGEQARLIKGWVRSKL